MPRDRRLSSEAWSVGRVMPGSSLADGSPAGGGADVGARSMPGRAGTIALAAAMLGLGTAAARGQDGGSEQDGATGSWGGARQRIVAAGITPSASYATDLLATPVGGAQQGFAYAGHLDAALRFDLQTLLGLGGSSFLIAAAWNSGRDLSERKIGNLFTVAQVFEGQSVRLAQMCLEQELFAETLSLAIGRLSAGDDFATSELYDNYVSGAINDNPAGITANAESFSDAPVASWGLRAIFQPGSGWRLGRRV
jgi:carbohydrate-selective porin OprB